MTVEFNTNLLKLNEEYSKSVLSDGHILVTPPINEDYWLFRVKVSEKQAIVCFPKFFTLGIGFQLEEDWNTNLPYTSDALKIYNHIKHNKGDAEIPDAVCIDAIKALQDACKNFLETKGDKNG